MRKQPHHNSRRAKHSRRLNLRFAVFALIGIVVCAGMAHGLRLYQLDRNADYVLQRAQRLTSEGSIPAALRDYRHYLKLRPDDLDALLEMTELLEDAAVSYDNLVEVFLAYEGILRKDNDRDDVRRQTIDLALRLQKFATALDHLKYLQKSAPNDPENFFETGQCFEGRGQHRKAVDEYLNAIAQGPSNIKYYERLVRLLFIHGEEFSAEDLKEIDILNRDNPTPQQVAENFMDEVVAHGRPAFEAYLARANYRKQLGRLERAAEDMQHALELAGDNTDVILSAADLSLDRAIAADAASRTEDADAHFQAAAQSARDGLQIDAADLRFFLILSRVELARDRLEDATNVLRDGIERYEIVRKSATQSTNKLEQKQSTAKLQLLHNQLLFSLSDLLMTLADNQSGFPDTDKLIEANEVIKKLPIDGPLASLAKFLLARMQIVNQQWRTALSILQSTEALEVPLTNLRRRISLETARCYQHLRNPDAQLSVLRRTVSNDPLWTEGRLAIAAALADSNQIDAAIREYRVFQHVPGVPTTIVRLMIVRELSRPIERRNWSEVQQMLDFATQVMPNSPEIPMLRAELLIQHENGFAKASALLDAARTELPDNVEVAASSVRLEIKRTDRDLDQRLATANSILDEAERKLGDHVEFRLARAELAALKDFDAACRDLQQLEDQIEAYTNNERFQLLSGLARIYGRKGAHNHAHRVWSHLAELYPQNLMVPLVLLQLTSESGDDVARQELLNDVRRIEGPNGPNGNYEEAISILNRLRRLAPSPGGNPTTKRELTAMGEAVDRARTLLAQAAEARPRWPAVPRAIGVLEDLAGNSDDAFAQFQRAIELGDYSREVVARVVQGLFLRKRYNEADTELKRLQTAQPDVITGEIARLAWRVAWQQQQFDRALGIARDVAEKSGDYKDTIWKAQLNFARGLRKKQDVEQPLRDAVADEIGHKSPSAWFALVAYLNRVGRTAEAADTILIAEEALPDNVAALVAGRCFEMVGKSKQAEERYRQAVKADPQNVTRLITLADFYTRNGASKKAEPYLEKILLPEMAASEVARSWARRRQALLLAGGGSYSARVAALATLDRNIGRKDANEAEVIADLRAKGLLLSANHNRADRLAAIKVYEEISTRQSLTSSERFRLAQLYDLTGDWNKARDILLNLVSGDAAIGAHLAYYVSALVRRDQLDIAQAYLKRLQEIEPDTFRTIATQARLLAALDRAAEAVPQLTTYINNRRTAAESLTDLLAQQNAREVLDILQSFLRDRLDQRGIQVIVQARELLAGNEPAQAIALLTEYIDDSQLAVASTAVLYRLAAKLCEEIGQTEPAERFFEQYAAESDNPRAVFLHATFLARQARLDEALTLCRKARADADADLFVSAAVSVIGHGQPTQAQLEEVRIWIQDALQARPDSSSAMIALGDLYLVERRFSKAEAAYRRLISMDKRNIAALNNLAWLLAYEKRDLREAARLIDQAIKQVGPVEALLDTRAMVHLAAGRENEAIEDLTEAFVNTVSPYSAIGHMHLALAYLQAGDKETSQQMFNLARMYGLHISGLHPQEIEKCRELLKTLDTPE